MKAIVPAAGQGTRLFPQTHTKPKPMVRVAGRPILGHILADLAESRIDEVVIVVGVMEQMVVEYVTETWGDELEVEFARQGQPEGLGHAVYQARSAVAGDPCCIVLGDMLFETDYDEFLSAHAELGGVDGSIGTKRVDDPTSYGIVIVKDGQIVELEEKPPDPESNLAVSGFYIVEDSPALFEALEYFVENDIRGAGDEYQLTDALQRTIDRGATYGTFEVGDWYDCGRPETLLNANRVLLERQGSDDVTVEGSAVLVPPVDLGDGVTVERSVVGPHVSVDDGATIRDSRVRDAIVGQGSALDEVNVARSLVGSRSRIDGTPHELNVGDSSEVTL